MDRKPPHPPVPKDKAKADNNPGTLQPGDWHAYFQEQVQLEISPEVIINVYLAGNWASASPLIVLHHGAGQSALTFALLARELRNDFKIAAFDCRGHGRSSRISPSDLTIELLTADCVQVVTQLRRLVRERQEGADAAHLVLCGHSMGGGVVVRAAAEVEADAAAEIVAVVLLDVCEQVAMQSLHLSKQFVSHFPTRFPSLPDAISWALVNVVNNRESAAISIPSQLEQDEDGSWRWRVNLLQSEGNWDKWFQGMNDIFLSLKAAKIVILAGIEKLDRDLTIAHMQGKFQLEALPKHGHLIQEDQAPAVALVLRNWSQRFHMLYKLTARNAAS